MILNIPLFQHPIYLALTIGFTTAMLVPGNYSGWTWLFVLGLSAGFGWILNGLSAMGVIWNTISLLSMVTIACLAIYRSRVKKNLALNWFTLSLGAGFVILRWAEGQWITSVAIILLALLLTVVAIPSFRNTLKYFALIPLIGHTLRYMNNLLELYAKHDEPQYIGSFEQLKLRPAEWKVLLKILISKFLFIILLQFLQFLFDPTVLFITSYYPTYLLSILYVVVMTSLFTMPALIVVIALIIRPTLINKAMSLDADERADLCNKQSLEREYSLLATHLRAGVSILFGFGLIVTIFLPWIDIATFGAYIGINLNQGIPYGYLSAFQLLSTSSLSISSLLWQIPLLLVLTTGVLGIIYGITHFANRSSQQDRPLSKPQSIIRRISVINNRIRWTLQLILVDNVLMITIFIMITLLILYSSTSGFPLFLGDGFIIGLVGLIVLRIWGMNEELDRPWRRKLAKVAVTAIGLSILASICLTAVVYTKTNVDDIPPGERTSEKLPSFFVGKIFNIHPQEISNEFTTVIPAGGYISGKTGNPMYVHSPDEIDAHWVILPAIEIDKYEVTNRDYAQFLDALSKDPTIGIPGKDHTPQYWDNPGHQPFWWHTADGTTDDYPVIGIDYYDAMVYAQWCGKRLPTSSEWEKVCRGVNGKSWPWGNYLSDDLHTNLCGNEGPDGYNFTSPVGSFAKDCSIFGVYDTAGNVAEWVVDEYSSEYGGIRGLAWSDKFESNPEGAYPEAATVYRLANRDYRTNWIGFRCAKDVETAYQLNTEIPPITRGMNWLLSRLGLGVPITEQSATKTRENTPAHENNGEDNGRNRQITPPEGAISYDDHGDSFESATVLGLGQSTKGEFWHKGDIDYFTWHVLELTKYRVTIIPQDGSELLATIFVKDKQSGEISQVNIKTDSQEIAFVVQARKLTEYYIKLEQVLGGYVDKYSIIVEAMEIPVTEQVNKNWISVKDMIQARLKHAAVLLQDGRVLVIGGKGISGKAINSVEIYDPLDDNWTQANPMFEARYDHRAILLFNGKVLVFGGFGVDDQQLTSVELYDPSNNTWSSVGRLSEPRSDCSAVLLDDGRVLVAGTYYFLDDVFLNSVEIYDPSNDEWTYADSMEEARCDHTATRLEDGRVLVAGGEASWIVGPCGRNPFRTPSSLVEVYDPIIDQWSLIEDMPNSVKKHESILTDDGTVLVVGGLDSMQRARTTASLYDPATDSWSSAGNMAVPRVGHKIIKLLDGRVLVIGGQRASQEGKLIYPEEIYDPAANTWASAGQMVRSRVSNTVTLLQDGRVLISGGRSKESEQTLASVEMFDPTK